MLRLAFSARIPYSRVEGLRTAILALPFKVLDNLKHPSVKMVGRAEESWNSVDGLAELFETLEEWNKYLKSDVPYFRDRAP